MYELLDPETKVQRVGSYGLQILIYLLSVDVVLCVALEGCPYDIVLQYYIGEDAIILRFMDLVAGQ